jgi:hypothetical protein
MFVIKQGENCQVTLIITTPDFVEYLNCTLPFKRSIEIQALICLACIYGKCFLVVRYVGRSAEELIIGVASVQQIL